MRVGTLLMFEGPILPLVWAVKLAAVLVLLAVSAVSVVVAVKVVPASAGKDRKIMSNRNEIRLNLRTRTPRGLIHLTIEN